MVTLPRSVSSSNRTRNQAPSGVRSHPVSVRHAVSGSPSRAAEGARPRSTGTSSGVAAELEASTASTPRQTMVLCHRSWSSR